MYHISLLYPCTLTNIKLYPYTHPTAIKITISYYVVSITFCCVRNESLFKFNTLFFLQQIRLLKQVML